MPRKAIVILYPGCAFFEIALAAEVLAGAMEVAFYTPDGNPHVSSTGAVILPTGSYEDAEVEHHLHGIVIVPGGDPGSIIPEAKAHRLLQSSRGSGAAVAGICGGVLVLASAGLLADVRVTHNYTTEFSSEESVAFTERYWKGCIYERADVMVDKNIITAMPWAYVEFAAAVALAVGTMTLAEASSFVSRHRRITFPWSGQIQAALESAAFASR